MLDLSIEMVNDDTRVPCITAMPCLELLGDMYLKCY